MYYAFHIEPYTLVTNRITLGTPSDDGTMLTVAQLSDFHIKDDFTPSDIEAVVEKTNAQTPDIVIFTGDLFDEEPTQEVADQTIDVLSKLQAPYGKFAVMGNRDAFWRYESVLTACGFTLLHNAQEIVEYLDKRILITGIDHSFYDFSDPLPTDIAQATDYNIFLSHEPDVVAQHDISLYQLILTGHTHGGQVDVPFLPFVNKWALAQTSFTSLYESHLNELQQREQYLYVNTGVGTTHVSARFCVPPEIAIFEIWV